MSTVRAARYLTMSAVRRLIGSFNHGSMANAMPQGIGAQVAFPERQVVAMCGDGELTMLLGDLSTIATLVLPMKLVVFDNGDLDTMHWEMLAEGYEPIEVELKSPISPSSPRHTGSGLAAPLATTASPTPSPQLSRVPAQLFWS